MTVKSIDAVRFFAEHRPPCEKAAVDAERCVRGQPVTRTWHQFTSDDEQFFAGTWEAEPGCWNIAYSENEYCEILSGRSILRDAAGAEHVLERGDRFVIPAGFEGQWEVIETTRKIYVIYQP